MKNKYEADWDPSFSNCWKMWLSTKEGLVPPASGHQWEAQFQFRWVIPPYEEWLWDPICRHMASLQKLHPKRSGDDFLSLAQSRSSLRLSVTADCYLPGLHAYTFAGLPIDGLLELPPPVIKRCWMEVGCGNHATFSHHHAGCHRGWEG